MRASRLLRWLFIALVCVLALPAAARAQSAIGGTVKDTSGAVLPGVTVEVASDVLIEKTKSVSTDGQGEYKIVDLRPGVYTITFSLQGFNTFKREGARAAVELHRHGQRRHESWRARGIGDGVRLVAGRRRAEQPEDAGAVARRARRGADRQDDPGPRPAGGRRHAVVARRRRLARDAAGLLRGARRRRLGRDRHGRRPADQRQHGRRRGDGVSQRSDDPGSGLPDRRRHRRDDHRRHHHEPGAQGRRQPLRRRHEVRQVAVELAGRQPDAASSRRSASARSTRSPTSTSSTSKKAARS